MRPSLSIYDSVYLLKTKPKLSGYFEHFYSILSQFSYLKDLLFRNFVMASLSCGHSSFYTHVISVLSRRCQKKMVRSHARRVVTVMADKESFWNRSEVNYPRNTMRRYFAETSSDEVTVPIFFSGTNPRPATIRLFNFWPEPLFDSEFCSKLSAEFYGTRITAESLSNAKSFKTDFAPLTNFGDRICSGHVVSNQAMCQEPSRCSLTLAARLV
jgi:hypothetical protein